MSILLNSQNDSITATTSSTSEIAYIFSFDVTGKQTFSKANQGSITSITTTTTVDGPSPNYYYAINDVSLVNEGVANNTVQVYKVVNGTSTPLLSTDVVLSAGEYLQYTSAEGWRKFTAGGEFITVGTIQSLVAGTNITIDDTDPANPIINATGGGGTLITATQELSFSSESDSTSVTIANASITLAGVKNFSYIPLETAGSSLDDFKLNGVSFSLQNIVDSTSFDIVGTAINNATGSYSIKYLITI